MIDLLNLEPTKISKDLKGKYIYVYVTSGGYTYEGSLKHLKENV